MLALSLCIAALLVAGALTQAVGGARRSTRPDQELHERRLRDGPDGRR